MLSMRLVTDGHADSIGQRCGAPLDVSHTSGARTRHNAVMTEQMPAAGSRRLERSIVLALLSAEDGRRSPREQLAGELNADAQAFAAALERLSDAGLVCLDGADVWASDAARRFDELGLIGI